MKKIVTIDSIIIISTIVGLGMLPTWVIDKNAQKYYAVILIIVMVGALIDMFVVYRKNYLKQTKRMSLGLLGANEMGLEEVTQVVLLNEENRAIKEWELKGRTSLLIGRENKDSDVEINLEEAEYSALIDYKHAVLNYANNKWFIEDLYSKNGIKIQKKQDGLCYKLAKDRPCSLAKGDIIFIANTKLLLQ